MKENKILDLDATGHCIGYGPKNAKFNFFGLEEKNGKYSKNFKKRNDAYINKFIEQGEKYYVLTNEEIYSVCPECKDEDRESNASIYKTYKTIYEKLSEDQININEIGNAEKSILVGNIYPFAKAQTNEKYSKEEKEWINNYGDDRSEYIINFLVEKAQNNYVFCFGNLEQYLMKFCQYGGISFGKTQKFKEFAYKSNIYYKAPSLNLYLLRHPSRGWLSHNQLIELLAKIKSY